MLSGHLRVALWAAAIAALGALLAGLGGGALARALPAGGSADPLPVYTSLSLAAEDEPVLPIWQRYDPDQVIDPPDGEPGLSLIDAYEFLFWPLGIHGVWDEGGDIDPLPFRMLTGDSGTAYYLKDYALPGTLMLTNLYSGRMMEQTGVTMDLVLGSDLNGLQMSMRMTFPDQPAANGTQMDQAVQLVQEELTRFLAGWQDTLLGVTAESWYPLTDGGHELVDRLQNRPFQDVYTLPEGESRLQQLCDEWMLDAQIIRLENEVLLTLTDRYGNGMLCLYYNARLCCVSGAAAQLA